MQILPFDPTNEAFLNWYVADAGQNPSDFILLGSDLRNGRALHRRLPPPSGLIHFPINDGLDLLLVFSDTEWPLICAAASIAPPLGAVPVELQQSREECCLTTPKVSFTHGTERSFRRFVNHPVLAHDTIVGNASYPDTVWHHYILPFGNLIWAEVIVIYKLGDDPYAIDDPYSDEQNWELPFVGKWVGGYLDAPQLLDWFVKHGQQPPETLIVALFEHSVLYARRLLPTATPMTGGATMAGPSQADPMHPPPTADEEIPDGPFGGDGFAWNGVLRTGLTSTQAAIMKALWNAQSGTIYRSDIDAAWPPDNTPDWRAVGKMLSELRKKLVPLDVTIEARTHPDERIQSNLAVLRRGKKKVSSQ